MSDDNIYYISDCGCAGEQQEPACLVVVSKQVISKKTAV
jgi:hypothetical protein